jgi:hypothetical protein
MEGGREGGREGFSSLGKVGVERLLHQHQARSCQLLGRHHCRIFSRDCRFHLRGSRAAKK